MATEVVDGEVQIDSGAMFRSIMDAPRGEKPTSETPAEPTQPPPELTEHQRAAPDPTQPTEQPIEQQPGERLRDPSTGRFMPRSGASPETDAATAGTVAPGATAEAEGTVPSGRLREIREERDLILSQLTELRAQNQLLAQQLGAMQRPQQAPPPPQAEAELPDPVLDPRGFYNAVLERVRIEQQSRILDMSIRNAHGRHGELFERAYGAFMQVAPQHPDFARTVVSGHDPGQHMVDWYNRQTMIAEIGPDPRAWMSRQLDEALKNPVYLQKAIDAATAQARGTVTQVGAASPQARAGTGQRSANVQLPPSLSRMPGGSPDDGSLEITENDNDHMFRHAMDARRKK